MSGKMSKIQGIDCSGNDLEHYKVGTYGINSEEDCQNKCLETDGCNATAYGSGSCQLKRRKGKRKADKRILLSRKN